MIFPSGKLNKLLIGEKRQAGIFINTAFTFQDDQSILIEMLS